VARDDTGARGTDEVIIYRGDKGKFLGDLENDGGKADYNVFFGPPNEQHVVIDWDGQ